MDFPLQNWGCYFKKSRPHISWHFCLDTSWPTTAALSNSGKKPRPGEEKDVCSCQGNDGKLQKRISILLGHVNRTLFTLFCHLQDKHHFCAWIHHLEQLITSLFGSSFPQRKWNNYTKTKDHRRRLRCQPTTRRMLLNGVKFTKAQGAMGTQTNFATPGKCGKVTNIWQN